MQRHGHEQVGFAQNSFNRSLLVQTIGEKFRERPFAVIFDLMNEMPNRLIENREPGDSLERSHAFAETSRARRITLCDGHAAGYASGRLSEC